MNLHQATYFPIQARWGKLGPIFKSEESTRLWRANLREYSEQRYADYKLSYKYDPKRYSLPKHHDHCDWRFDRRRPGPMPAFWDFACHSACHWVVDMALYVARSAYGKVPWRVVSSQKHSTVWDGDEAHPVLFDINFLALGISAPEALKLATTRGRILKPGRYLRPWAVRGLK